MNSLTHQVLQPHVPSFSWIPILPSQCMAKDLSLTYFLSHRKQNLYSLGTKVFLVFITAISV